MHGEEHAAQPAVKVDGRTLPDDVAPLLVSLTVDTARNVPDLVALRFLDERGIVLSKAGFAIGAALEVSVRLSGPGGELPLFKGEVTALEAELDVSGLHTVVRGLDRSHRLFRGRRTEAYVKMSANDIARKVASRAGLQGEASAVDGASQIEHVAQDNISDWDFLQALAARAGASVRVDDRKLVFATPTKASTAPPASGSDSPRENPLVLERGVNLLALRATVTASGQVPEVQARGWDPRQKQAVVVTASAATTSAQLADADPAKIAKLVSAPPYVLATPTLAERSEVKARADALAERIAGGFAELEGVAVGNPAMKAGVAVVLRQVGSPFDGRYVLTSVRHTLVEGGFQTAFTVAGGSERSLLGSGGVDLAGGSAARSRQHGVLSAIVTDVKDPAKLNRVKVKIPVLSDTFETCWARVVQPGAGASRGTGLLPEVNDEVLVAFADGDTNQPYVLGGLYNGKDTPEPDQVNSDGTVGKRVFVSRTGMRAEFLETPAAEELVLSTSGGKQKLRFVQKSQALVELLSEGPLKVVAQQDVTVESKQNVTVTTSAGNVSVKGVDVAVEGSKSLTLKAPQVSIQGQATAELKAPQVKVAADAQVEVSGNAMAVLRGGLVKIN